jgi:hypothetical protein
MKVTRTGMTTVIAQAYAAYKRSGPVEETKPAVAGGMVMGEHSANNWLASGQDDPRQKTANTNATQAAEPAKASLSTSTLSLPRKGGTDIIV